MLIGCGILIGVMAGGGGIVTTDLASDVTASATQLHVLTTTDFLEEDYLIIGSEKIFYTATNATYFLGCTRGYDDTDAAEHEAGARVYTEFSSTINYAVGFNMAAVQDEMGWATVFAIPIMFFVRTIPHIIKMSTNLLTGELAIISWFFYAMAAGFVVTLALTLIGSRRVF